MTALLTTAALGPSAAVEPLPGSPPFGWHAHPPAALVTALLAIVVIAGAYGVGGCLAALRRGWALDVRPLLVVSFLVAIALGLMAPVGSSDPGSYAAYGQLAASGHDPYVTPPSALAGPYAQLAEPPWQGTTSVYGPIATGEQWLAAKLAGPNNPAHAVFLLSITGAVAFIACGLLLVRLAAGRAGRRRAAVLFAANPLLLFEGVAGAHLDVVVTFLAVLAIAAFAAGRRPTAIGAFVAGVFGGAAAGFKASAALVGLGLAWATGHGRRSARRLIALAVGAAAVLVPGYVLAGGHAFDQLETASGFVSFADEWRIITHPLESVLGHDAARALIRALAWLAFVILVALLHRGLPGRRQAAVATATRQVAAARAAAVLVLAWLLTAPYVLPWYAIIAFALLTLLPPSGFDRLMVFWTSVLALAYLPGRQVAAPGWLHHILDIWKSGISPVLLLCAAIVAAILSIRERA